MEELILSFFSQTKVQFLLYLSFVEKFRSSVRKTRSGSRVLSEEVPCGSTRRGLSVNTWHAAAFSVPLFFSP